MEDFLRKNGVHPDLYLQSVRRIAQGYGFDPEKIRFPSVKSKAKLSFETPEGKMVYFGRVPYGDFILWNIREVTGKVPNGFAMEKREWYLKRARGIERHRQVKGDEYSPNQLAMKVLWMV